MSRKAIKVINWAALAERIPEAEKAALAAFKSKSDQYLQRMMANPESPPAIDWAYYKKNISAPSLVEKFQKEYEALSIPYPADKYTSAIEAAEKESAKEIDQLKQNVDKEINVLQAEIADIKAMLPIQLMTAEDYCILYPDGTWSKENISLWPHSEDAQDTPEDELPDEEEH
ncbi:ATP synthase subunit d, mitochondrial [Megachile rotundata]|uniref:ATP synthase subunit d, mitochondrial n=1 Tax=Megachile rotundata TaxID=143995 RepID=UPI000258E005|nr:PREDICTED: ATP synthase subunit d, mitochondrial-like [Megachile rotundata]